MGYYAILNLYGVFYENSFAAFLITPYFRHCYLKFKQTIKKFLITYILFFLIYMCIVYVNVYEAVFLCIKSVSTKRRNAI